MTRWKPKHNCSISLQKKTGNSGIKNGSKGFLFKTNTKHKKYFTSDIPDYMCSSCNENWKDSPIDWFIWELWADGPQKT